MNCLLMIALCLAPHLGSQSFTPPPGLVPVFAHPLEGTVNAVCVSRGGRLLAEANQEAVLVWDVRSGRPLYNLLTNTDSACPVAFSPDGRLLAIGSFQQIGSALTIRIVNAASGKLLYTLRQLQTGESLNPAAIIFAPSGNRLAVGCDSGMVEIWDYEAAKPVAAIRLHRCGEAGSAMRLAFSPDGSMLATAYDQVEVWRLSTLDRTAVATIDAEVNALAFSPDGSQIAIGAGNWMSGYAAVELRSTDELTLQRRLRGLPGAIQSIAFSPNGQDLLAVNSQGVAARWRFPKPTPALTFSAPGFQLPEAVSPDASTVVGAGWERTLIAYDGLSGRPTHSLSDRLIPFGAVSFSRDGNSLIADASYGAAANSSSEGLRLYTRWSLQSFHLESVRASGSDNSLSYGDPLSTLPGSSLAQAMREGALVDRVFRLLPDDLQCWGWALNRARTLMAVVASHNASAGYPEIARRVPDIYLVDVRRMKILRHQSLGGWLFLAVGFTDGGRSLIAVTRDMRIWIQPLHEQHPAVSIPLPFHDWVSSAAISPDGDSVAIGSFRHGIYLWRRKEGTARMAHLAVPKDSYLQSLQFSSDGRFLEADGSLVAWNSRSMKRILSFPPEIGSNPVTFSPDGRTMAVVDGDGAIRLFEFPTGRELAALRLVVDSRSAATALYWLARTPGGSYCGSPGLEKLLEWQSGAGAQSRPGSASSPAAPKIEVVHDADSALAVFDCHAMAALPRISTCRCDSTPPQDPTEHLRWMLNNRNCAPFGPVDAAFRRTARWLLARGADLNAMSGQSRSLLHVYAETGDLAEVRRLLRYRRQIQQRVLDSALLAAAGSGKLDILPLLVTAGADIPDHHDHSLLHPLASPTVLGAEALDYFVSGGMRSMADIACALIYLGADPNATDTYGDSLLMRVLEAGPAWSDAAGYLVRHGARIKVRNSTNDSPLYFAVRSEDTASVRLLLRHGADPNPHGERPDIPLNTAIEKDSPEMIRLLLNAGADPNISLRYTESPLATAAEYADLTSAQYLVAHGARPLDPSDDVRSALEFAVINKDREMVKLLLHYRANVHHRNKDGETLLAQIHRYDPEDLTGIGGVLRHAGAD